MSLGEIRSRLAPLHLSPEKVSLLIEMLLWFAFLGVAKASSAEGEGIFICDVNYDMKKLRVLAGNFSEEKALFSIHKAFWPFLSVPNL